MSDDQERAALLKEVLSDEHVNIDVRWATALDSLQHSKDWYWFIEMLTVSPTVPDWVCKWLMQWREGEHLPIKELSDDDRKLLQAVDAYWNQDLDPAKSAPTE